MIASFVIAVLFSCRSRLGLRVELITGVSLTTVTWIVVTLMTPPSDMKSLLAFYKRPNLVVWVRPANGILPQPEPMWPQIIQALSGIICIYGFPFGIGKLVYGDYLFGVILLVVAIGIAMKLVTSKSLLGRGKRERNHEYYLGRIATPYTMASAVAAARRGLQSPN